MLVLALPRDRVAAALPPVEQRLARRPDAWSTLAARGKLRRLLGDRGGLDDLRSAAAGYLRVHAADPSLLTPAHLYRLAGDDRAQDLLERSRAGLLAGPATSSLTSRLLAETCFLLGDDEQAAAGGDLHDVARLAVGRVTGDVALVDEVVASLDRRAARGPVATGAMGPHDWLEIALVTRAQVSGQASGLLVEL